MILLPLLLFLSSQLMMMYTMENSALYRNLAGDFSVDDFKRNSFHYLWAEKITSAMVEDQFDCIFLCVAEPKCYLIIRSTWRHILTQKVCICVSCWPLTSTGKLKSFTLMLPSIISAHG